MELLSEKVFTGMENAKLPDDYKMQLVSHAMAKEIFWPDARFNFLVETGKIDEGPPPPPGYEFDHEARYYAKVYMVVPENYRQAMRYLKTVAEMIPAAAPMITQAIDLIERA
jgi:hypothetical protein